MGNSPGTPSDVCPPAGLTVQQPFDLEAYISEPWWVQEQMETQYLPIEQNYCVKAQYTKDFSSLGRINRWLAKKKYGYDVLVENFSRREDGSQQNSGGNFFSNLCADQVDGAKLQVAPCWLPTSAAGPYWVLEFAEDDPNLGTYALISGGAPGVEATPDPSNPDDKKCRTGTGINDSGLWIFTREQNPDGAVVDALRQKLDDMGFDTTVLNPVDNSNCD